MRVYESGATVLAGVKKVIWYNYGHLPDMRDTTRQMYKLTYSFVTQIGYHEYTGDERRIEDHHCYIDHPGHEQKLAVLKKKPRCVNLLCK